MTGAADGLLDRLRAVPWSDPHGAAALRHARSRAALMREYLRRSALWTREIESVLGDRTEAAEAHGIDPGRWPFADFAALIDPAVRAAPDRLAALRAAVPYPQATPTGRACARALHLAALRDAGVALPRLPDPFEPLVVLFERGGGFTVDGTGFIDLFGTSLPRGAITEHLRDEPAAPLDAPALDALDGGADADRPALRAARTWDATGPDGAPLVRRPPVPAEEREALAAYLEQAPAVLSSRRPGPDLLDEGRAPLVPRTYHTDGAWIWPGEIGYYLRAHAVPPPPELVEHARARGFRVPPVDDRIRRDAIAAVMDAYERT